MPTLTHYAHLKAYWFNPDTTKVTVHLRNHRDFGTHFHRDDILTRLAVAKSKL